MTPKRGQLLPWADKSLLFARHEGLAWDGFGKGGDSLPDDLQSARGAAAITQREDMLLHVLSFGASSGIRTPGEAGRLPRPASRRIRFAQKRFALGVSGVRVFHKTTGSR